MGGHVENWACQSEHFQDWLAGLFWRREERPVGSEALKSSISVIRCKARFEGEQHRLHNRVAHADGVIWYDSADPEWRAIRVSAKGWEVVADPPVAFRRHAHQCAQVMPARGAGRVRDLLQFINVRDEADRLLLLVYAVSCLISGIPHPVLILHGPQGAAKTSAARILRRLIDPSTVEVLTLPHDDRELVQQLTHHHMPCYDNVSSIREWVSDVFCRAATGAGFSKRQLHTDEEDVIFSIRSCLVINGINVVAYKPDLLDRSILIELAAIDPGARRSEEELFGEFDRVRPGILGAVFDVLSAALAIRPTVKTNKLHRMADFILWGCAIAEALGHSRQEFLAAYDRNVSRQTDEVIENSPVAATVVEFVKGRASWSGTASSLLRELQGVAERLCVRTNAEAWPKGPSTLGRRLNEVSANLAAQGVRYWRQPKGRVIHLVREEPEKYAPNGNGTDGTSGMPLPVPSPGEAGICWPGHGSNGSNGTFPLVRENLDSKAGRVASTTPGQRTENAVTGVTAVTLDLTPSESSHCGGVHGNGTGHGTEVSRRLPPRRSDWPRYAQELFEERAAILEFDACLDREDAEKQAEMKLRILARNADTGALGDRN